MLPQHGVSTFGRWEEQITGERNSIIIKLTWVLLGSHPLDEGLRRQRFHDIFLRHSMQS